MAKISCFIIAKNEELNIAKSISSVIKICEEVIVIDSGSTDKTVEIAESMGARVVFNEWPGYLKQKIYGESLCQNEWILNIDADEELPQDLQDEISTISALDIIEQYKAYRINFIILMNHHIKPKFLAPSNKFIRLYNKNYGSFARNKGDSTHDDVKMDTGIKKDEIFDLFYPAFHRSWTSLAHLVAKSNFYSSQQAEAMERKKRKYSTFRIIFEFPASFLKAFFIRRYFIFGLDGFVVSMIFAFSRYLRLVKLREIYLLKKIKR
ncbi:MAG: glycosyltransferase family 2 protein [Rickettsiaceae bacterium]|nr:glycosyltransferase family 2 protein [Rickettsiaceae bacterium]